MNTHKTITDKDFKIAETDFNYTYQVALTKRLDEQRAAFDQNVINEIVLWKVNRYATIDTDTLNLINSIDSGSKTLDTDKTKRILQGLLKTHGINLPIASTILKFKNRNIYQIIDQRVYRIIYTGKKLKLKQYRSDKNIIMLINLYFQYLKDLRDVCGKFNLPFDRADRILYMADKRINKEHKLNY